MKKFSKIVEDKSFSFDTHGTNPEENISLTWDAEFGSSTPTSAQVMEFYHQLREAGFDGDMIYSIIKYKKLL